jgi:hypothetical protein
MIRTIRKSIRYLQQLNAFSKDWEGKLYCGIHIQWDYKKRTVDLSMPGYISATLHKFQHQPPASHRREHSMPPIDGMNRCTAPIHN